MNKFWQKYRNYFPVVFFLGGFLFDILTLDRIDSNLQIITQAIYLLLSGLLLGYEFGQAHDPKEPRWAWMKNHWWTYHDLALQFMFGSLLSIYTLFYFKSSSFITSFFFVGILVLIMLINEFYQNSKIKVMMRQVIFSICLLSFFIYLLPILFGFMGILTFLCSVVISIGVYWLFSGVFLNKGEVDRKFLLQHWLKVKMVVVTVIVGFYFLKIIPPVPLSLKEIGLYRSIKRVGDSYELTYCGAGWKFWQKSESTFLAKENDQLIIFASVFAPTGFDDQLMIHWYQEVNSSWVSQDVVSFSVKGGRDNGFRGYASKKNYTAGNWKVSIQNKDGQELGRYKFEIVDASMGASEVCDLQTIFY